ncbi:MAG: Hpt domain-containing protein [Desulfovibrionaceae bacterium]|nr:Hpt domain-containing protein [Desulfovibrionaceae bacterium]MBF0513122.1 Hpt domain-containing protein [Desulfovibrionaceae bacterium]
MDNPAVSLDQAAALKRLDGDVDIYRVLAGVFLEDAPVQMDKLGEAIGSGDVQCAMGIAHTLKSGARTVGAMLLGELCAELECGLATGGQSPAGDVFARLLAEYRQIARLLETEIGC